MPTDGRGTSSGSAVIRPGMLTDGQSNEYDRRYSQGLDAYGRAMQEWGLEYGTESDTYNRSWDQFLNRQNQWERDQGNRWNRTMTTALLNSGGGV